MDERNRGFAGEKGACRFLKKNGYKILQTNYATRFGEIDIIAQKGEFIAFVEVKTRNENTIASPGEFVNNKKQQRIIITAQHYLLEEKTDRQPRVDVIEIMTEKGKIREINHIENAF